MQYVCFCKKMCVQNNYAPPTIDESGKYAWQSTAPPVTDAINWNVKPDEFDYNAVGYVILHFKF